MKNVVSVVLAALLSSAIASPALAAQEQLSPSLENAITRAIAQHELLPAPLEVFHQQIQQIAQPQQAPLLQALQTLTAYNRVFETEPDAAVLRTLAAQLEGPISVPWNTYRGNGLKEIFNNYVPNSHGNKQVALLEYYIKFHTLPQKTLDRTAIVSKILPAEFTKAYNQLSQNLAAQSNRNDKKLIQLIARFAPAYNKLAEQNPVVAKELKHSLFDMPIQTGWDRTFSLKELSAQIGIEDDTERYSFHPAGYLQTTFGVNASDAAIFASFVRDLKIYANSQRTVQDRTAIISKVLPAEFTKAYNQLSQNLAAQSNRNDKKLIQLIARFAPAYNKLAEQNSLVAEELKHSLFEMPIQTGWNQTFSLKELSAQIGIEYFTEGYSFRPAGYLQTTFGASPSDAAVFAAFVRALDIYGKPRK